jgi:hypothetical protein
MSVNIPPMAHAEALARLEAALRRVSIGGVFHADKGEEERNAKVQQQIEKTAAVVYELQKKGNASEAQDVLKQIRLLKPSAVLDDAKHIVETAFSSKDVFGLINDVSDDDSESAFQLAVDHTNSLLNDSTITEAEKMKNVYRFFDNIVCERRFHTASVNNNNEHIAWMAIDTDDPKKPPRRVSFIRHTKTQVPKDKRALITADRNDVVSAVENDSRHTANRIAVQEDWDAGPGSIVREKLIASYGQHIPNLVGRLLEGETDESRARRIESGNTRKQQARENRFASAQEAKDGDDVYGGLGEYGREYK